MGSCIGVLMANYVAQKGFAWQNIIEVFGHAPNDLLYAQVKPNFNLGSFGVMHQVRKRPSKI